MAKKANGAGKQPALTAEAILAADDLQPEAVHVPEWGGPVYVRAMNAAERDEWDLYLSARREAKAAGETDYIYRNARARLVVLCACDAEGNRLFGDDQAEALGRKSGRALERVFDTAWRKNGLGAEHVEAMQGNSETTQGDGSSSG